MSEIPIKLNILTRHSTLATTIKISYKIQLSTHGISYLTNHLIKLAKKNCVFEWQREILNQIPEINKIALTYSNFNPHDISLEYCNYIVLDNIRTIDISWY